MTYAQSMLESHGFHLVKETKPYPFIHTTEVEFALGHTNLTFKCCCPCYPHIKALGCPIHHEGPGGSWPITDAINIAKLLKK